jgi:hypothetical protein
MLIIERATQNADPALEKMLDRETNIGSVRGWFNVGTLTLVIVVLVGLFAGWYVPHIQSAGGNGPELNLTLRPLFSGRSTTTPSRAGSPMTMVLSLV